VRVFFQSGYYVPDTKVVRENYRVVTPAISDFNEYGHYIALECRNFDSYRLVKEGEPIGIATLPFIVVFNSTLKFHKLRNTSFFRFVIVVRRL